MYERFTDRARMVMQLAHDQAMRFKHEYIGTEHILLGLVTEGQGLAAVVLAKLNVDLRTVWVEIGKIVSAVPTVVPPVILPHTPRAKMVIEYAHEEARDLRQHYVGTEHILLGLIRQQECVAAQVLMNLGLKLEDVREKVLVCMRIDPAVLAAHLLTNSPARAPAPDSSTTSRLEARVAALESQLVTTRFLLGCITGTAAGVALGQSLGAVVGLLVGGGISLVRSKIPTLLVGAVTGGFVASAQFGDEGSASAGVVIGALLSACVAEIGRPPRAIKPARSSRDSATTT